MNDGPARVRMMAPAKLNLALAVGTPAPPKGYHPIASWFVATDLCDDVEIERCSPGTPSVHRVEWHADAPKATPIDWPIEKDLAVRAHRLLESATGRELPLKMTVRKRIPVGGGLGGGSSDAAAALVGINWAFGLGLRAEALRELSTRLGSDVAFFIDDDGAGSRPRPAIVTGFGERIERCAGVPRGWRAVLLFPPFGCPTGAVYAAFDARPAPAFRDQAVRGLVARAADGGLDPRALFNDLAQPACDAAPALADVLKRLAPAGGDAGEMGGASDIGPVHVTGSGSTMFVLVGPDAGEAGVERVMRAVGVRAPEVVVCPVSVG